jgi:hypothetical protein
MQQLTKLSSFINYPIRNCLFTLATAVLLGVLRWRGFLHPHLYSWRNSFWINQWLLGAEK